MPCLRIGLEPYVRRGEYESDELFIALSRDARLYSQYVLFENGLEPYVHLGEYESDELFTALSRNVRLYSQYVF